MTNASHTTNETGTRAAARSALDVMLTEAVTEPSGVGRFVRPTAAGKVVASLGRHPDRVRRRIGDLGTALAQIAGGQSGIAPGNGDRRFNDSAWQDNWLLRRILQAYLAAGDDRRWADHRRRPGLASGATGPLRRDQRARRDRADQLPLVEPGRAEGDHQPGRREPRARRPPVCAGHGAGAATPDERRHEQVRGRRQPGRFAWFGRAANRRFRTDPVHADAPSRCARCRCCSSRRRSTSYYILDIAPGRSMIE